MNAWQLAKALDRPSLSLLREVCARFARGHVPPELPQDEALATEAPFLDPDGEGATLRFGDTTERCLGVAWSKDSINLGELVRIRQLTLNTYYQMDLHKHHDVAHFRFSKETERPRAL